MTTYVLLARHGKAEKGLDDLTRRLTPEGRAGILRVASHLKRVGASVDVIEHSGLVRAAGTAEIFAQELGATPVRAEGLTPDADPATLARRLSAAGDQRIMLVSHAPLLCFPDWHLICLSARTTKHCFTSARAPSHVSPWNPVPGASSGWYHPGWCDRWRDAWSGSDAAHTRSAKHHSPRLYHPSGTPGVAEPSFSVPQFLPQFAG